MLAWTISALLDAGCFHRIIVSTDDEEIMQVAQEWGAEVPFVRPPEIADDHTPVGMVMLHCLEWCRDNGGNRSFPKFSCLVFCSAFCEADYIKQGFDIMVENDCNGCFTCIHYDHPIQRAMHTVEDGTIIMFQPEYRNTRTQDCNPKAIYDAGMFYWVNCDKYMKGDKDHYTNAKPLIISRESHVDVDNPEDWETAEIMHQFLEQKRALAKK